MPDPDRPSGAPLSDSEADRLSERFTASWDDPDLASSVEPAAVPLAAPAVATASGAVVTSLPSTPRVAKPKHTLLGIAPIVVGPSQPPPAAPAAVSPAPAAAPPAAAPVSPPEAAAAVPALAPGASAPVAAATAASTPAPTPSSPDAGSVAQGLTTPSKPYIPKDDPSTPAVVISEAAFAGTGHGVTDRARIAQTIPTQIRSAPAAASAPQAIPSSPVSSALDDTYPPARRRSGKLPLFLGGAAVLAVVAIAAIMLRGADSKPATTSAPSSTERAIAPVPPQAEPPAPAAATPAEVASAGGEQPAAKSAEPVPEPPPVVAKRGKPLPPPKKAAAPAPAPRKAAAKPEPKPAAPASEPAPAPKPAKGVIVRETPF